MTDNIVTLFTTDMIDAPHQVAIAMIFVALVFSAWLMIMIKRNVVKRKLKLPASHSIFQGSLTLAAIIMGTLITLFFQGIVELIGGLIILVTSIIFVKHHFKEFHSSE